jgi:hypothetical protein
MSYELSNSQPKVTLRSHFLINAIYFGEYTIPMKDFVLAVEYVLTNSDLYENDPRLELIETIKKSSIVDGWNKTREPNCKRITFKETENV